MKVEKIDHIHMYVKDIGQAVQALTDVIGTDFARFGDGSFFLDLSDRFGVKVAHHHIGLHLMQVTDPTLRAAKLPKGGLREGVVAISVKVPDTDAAVAELESRGAKVLARDKVGHVIETLLDWPDIPGMQIELSEYPGEDIIAAAGK